MSQLQNISLFEQALGPDWARLAPAVQKHYGLALDSSDHIELEGRMSVHYPLPAFVLLGFARLFGGPVLLREENIPVRVKNSTRSGSKAMFWHRAFKRPGKKAVLFRSFMVHAGGQEIIEYVGKQGLVNMGIRMAIREEEEVLIYESTGYLLKIGPVKLPVPGHILLGRARIEERGLDEHRIAMKFGINHPLLGRVYSYAGLFRLCPRSAR